MPPTILLPQIPTKLVKDRWSWERLKRGCFSSFPFFPTEGQTDGYGDKGESCLWACHRAMHCFHPEKKVHSWAQQQSRIKSYVGSQLAHCCAIFMCYLFRQLTSSQRTSSLFFSAHSMYLKACLRCEASLFFALNFQMHNCNCTCKPISLSLSRFVSRYPSHWLSLLLSNILLLSLALSG